MNKLLIGFYGLIISTIVEIWAYFPTTPHSQMIEGVFASWTLTNIIVACVVGFGTLVKFAGDL